MTTARNAAAASWLQWLGQPRVRAGGNLPPLWGSSADFGSVLPSGINGSLAALLAATALLPPTVDFSYTQVRFTI